MLAESLAELLRLQGHEVQVAFCGKSAVQMAARFVPETLITDIVMPDMNGVEAATQIRILSPACKIILMTGRSAAADLVLKTHALADGFELVSKPIHPRDLLRRL
jgi:DNA-binding response OmpR family regulator